MIPRKFSTPKNPAFLSGGDLSLDDDILPCAFRSNLLRMIDFQTSRVHRTWLERLLLWRRAYETKIFDENHEVRGRGPTPKASQKNAERYWLAEIPAEEQQQSGRISAPSRRL